MEGYVSLGSLDDMRIDKAGRPSRNFNEVSPTSINNDRREKRAHAGSAVAHRGTYLGCSILRSALRLRQLALSTSFAPVAQAVVAAAVSARTHHPSCSADRRVDVVVVGTCAARCLHVVVAMRTVLGGVDNGGELSS